MTQSRTDNLTARIRLARNLRVGWLALGVATLASMIEGAVELSDSGATGIAFFTLGVVLIGGCFYIRGIERRVRRTIQRDRGQALRDNMPS